MAKPRFRLENMEAHYSGQRRFFLQPINAEAWQMLQDRDAGKISDFALVLYQPV